MISLSRGKDLILKPLILRLGRDQLLVYATLLHSYNIHCTQLNRMVAMAPVFRIQFKYRAIIVNSDRLVQYLIVVMRKSADCMHPEVIASMKRYKSSANSLYHNHTSILKKMNLWMLNSGSNRMRRKSLVIEINLHEITHLRNQYMGHQYRNIQ